MQSFCNSLILFVLVITMLLVRTGCLCASLKTCRMHFCYENKIACIFFTQYPPSTCRGWKLSRDYPVRPTE
ncbi:hypothetical protein M758_3G157500 [Ceratodon purpureus]|nr:hypothetical protein M758_3G157500 [Ceratodon purpureus]